MRRNSVGEEGFCICVLNINEDPGNLKNYEPKTFSEGWKHFFSEQELEDLQGNDRGCFHSSLFQIGFFSLHVQIFFFTYSGFSART